MLGLLEHIAAQTARLLGCERASIFLWDKSRKELVGRPALGMPNNELRIPETTGVVGRTLATGETQIVEDVKADPSFTSKVDKASGFQSSQFRELEFALGYKRASTVNYLKPDFPGYDRLQQLLHERSLVDHFYDFLKTRGAQIPGDLKNRDVTQPNAPDKRVQEEILRRYKDSPECTILFELMTDFDEGLQEWRYRHIKLVERTIGAKKGTGGSPGLPFLKESLFKPVFHDLWAIRHEM